MRTIEVREVPNLPTVAINDLPPAAVIRHAQVEASVIRLYVELPDNGETATRKLHFLLATGQVPEGATFLFAVPSAAGMRFVYQE